MDIVDIKIQTKNKKIKFYIANGYIYCQDIKTGEIACVGDYQELVIKSNGIYVRGKGELNSINLASIKHKNT